MPKKLILKDFELTEISSVDRPAQPTALMSIIKRRVDDEECPLTIIKQYLEKSHENVVSFADILLEDKLDRAMWPMTDALMRSIRSIIKDNDLNDVTKGSLINDTVTAFTQALTAELGVDGNAMVKIAKQIKDGTLTKRKKEGETMPNKTEIEKQLDETKTLLADVQSQLKKAEALSKLSDGEKTFMADMSEDEKTAFKALSADERKAKINLVKRDDETLVVDGATVSKSAVGDATFSVLKAQQARITAQGDEIKKAQDATEIATLTKRASDEFSHLPGTERKIADVLKALKSAPVEVVETVEAIFKSAQSLMDKAFTKQGGNLPPISVDGQNATEKLETLTKSYSETNSVAYETAYAAVIDQNPELYKQILGEAQ